MSSMTTSAPLYMNYQVQEDYVPILGYHAIGTFTNSLTVEIEDYKDQVDYLTNVMGCNWVTMADLAVYIENGEKVPTNTCVMNFDDGTADHYHAGLCALNEHNVPATFYVISSDIGSSGFYMSASEVQKLYTIGHDIGSHTLFHARLSDLTYSEQEVQILDSKTELENMGYTVNTFAYPFGAYNDDTLDILRNSGYVLARDTSQDFSWKDKRASLVSFNPDNDLHFYYIKPEGFSGAQLADVIKYTGWWQFEDNFKTIVDTDGDVAVRSSSIFIPTATSFGVLSMRDVGDEISTQFITKYSGGFTLDIFMHTTSVTVGFEVKVDGVTYTPAAFPSNDPGFIQGTSSGGFVFQNYYVNVPSLSPGKHTINVVNTDAVMYLDKFRLWSNVDQDFSDASSYVQCNPATDDYCDCTLGLAPSPADPTCALGVLSGDTCCLAECGVCGGTGCGSNPGGSTGCCETPIIASGDSCDDRGPPCIVTPAPTPADPTCALGLLAGDVCCSAECGQCGGTGCGSFPGGSDNCCGTPITTAGNSCNDGGAPCVIDVLTPVPTPAPTPAPGTDPMCLLGLISGDTCCSSSCGTCGGPGCGAAPGGGANCCGGPIASSGLSCDDNVAPCVISPPTPTPTPPPTPDPTCALGLISGDTCCSSSCGTCGGPGCGAAPGGGANCCGGPIAASGLSCDSNAAPCVIGL